MNCKNCGNVLEGDPAYCPHCGTIVDRPNPMQPNPMQPNLMHPNQISPNQGPFFVPQPGMLPPPVPPHLQVHPKRSKALLPLFIIGIVVFYFVLILMVVIATVRFAFNVQNTGLDRLVQEYGLEEYEDSEDIFNGFEDYGFSFDEEENGTDYDTFGNDGEDYYYDDSFQYGFGKAETMYYTYSELPYVASIDSDYRFAMTDYIVADGISTYSFEFTEETAAEEAFNMVIDEYIIYLQDWNGYYIDQVYTDQAFAESGVYTTYLTEGQSYLGITPHVVDGEYIASINIFFTKEGMDTQYSLNPNYDTFLLGRDFQAFEQYTEIVMENGVSFYLNDIVVNDLGDGTASVDASIDLASYSTDNYLYPEDFLLLPMDRAGNSLGDACSVEYITDSKGDPVLTPMLLDTEEYQNFTVSFVVPADLETFNIYGTNYSTEGFSGPVYYIEMQVDE